MCATQSNSKAIMCDFEPKNIQRIDRCVVLAPNVSQHFSVQPNMSIAYFSLRKYIHLIHMPAYVVEYTVCAHSFLLPTFICFAWCIVSRQNAPSSTRVHDENEIQPQNCAVNTEWLVHTISHAPNKHCVHCTSMRNWIQNVRMT